MKEEIEIPEGVEVSLTGKSVEARGPLGAVARDLSFMPRVSFSLAEGKLAVETAKGHKKDRMFLHTAASHVKNLLTGVTRGYRYELDIVHVHFPMRLSIQGDKLVLDNFLGSKTPRKGWKYPDVEVKVKDKKVTVEGLNKEHVGQTAANIEQLTRVKNKDRRVFRDGIFLTGRGHMEVGE
jgi:large subunit ribosomal protein L6